MAKPKQVLHRVTNPETSTLTGMCSVCGPNVPIRLTGTRINGEDKWRCWTAWRMTKRISAAKASPEVLARKRAGMTKWYSENKDWVRRYSYQRNYGITVEDYDRMLIEQGGVCGICQGPPSGPGAAGGRFHVDHSPERVRGLLCGPCNIGIGLLRHDAELMTKAIAWCT